MNVKTKFELGQEVLFIHNALVYRSTIQRISIEMNYSGKGLPDPIPLITYHFLLPSAEREQIYRYEDEIASTKEELIQRVVVHC